MRNRLLGGPSVLTELRLKREAAERAAALDSARKHSFGSDTSSDENNDDKPSGQGGAVDKRDIKKLKSSTSPPIQSDDDGKRLLASLNDIINGATVSGGTTSKRKRSADSGDEENMADTEAYLDEKNVKTAKESGGEVIDDGNVEPRSRQASWPESSVENGNIEMKDVEDDTPLILPSHSTQAVQSNAVPPTGTMNDDNNNSGDEEMEDATDYTQTQPQQAFVPIIQPPSAPMPQPSSTPTTSSWFRPPQPSYSGTSQPSTPSVLAPATLPMPGISQPPTPADPEPETTPQVSPIPSPPSPESLGSPLSSLPSDSDSDDNDDSSDDADQDTTQASTQAAPANDDERESVAMDLDSNPRSPAPSTKSQASSEQASDASNDDLSAEQTAFLEAELGLDQADDAAKTAVGADAAQTASATTAPQQSSRPGGVTSIWALRRARETRGKGEDKKEETGLKGTVEYEEDVEW
ncbi:hypothetical protein P153DRAFT_24891 [Dothidotthia symphoricarpi CBS 119687]|uniref:Uncharacterized protein n=1 Tax=Dothidotthia symphoricarpi CBS 119687 TaxID=1392245 RepID=A0A6A6AD06_9PLEO|nr:uncharacterized protein P153DRAFT_24891 [Dothidotthia symphoricarpi CBS 119687]KAF2128757.1 hypothetical protein P153DRAFT_24891 [Dothidotthia symphoricarpi CBS 119687]